MKLSEDMDLNYDAIVVLSGDGGLHEVVNGLAKHPEAHKALRIPLAQIPTGSANALCCNHFGPKVRRNSFVEMLSNNTPTGRI